MEKEACEINLKGELLYLNAQKKVKIDFAIPCIHGDLGETGDIQSFFKLAKIPYLGANPEASILCFNKISTKLWLEKANIPIVPFLIITKLDNDNILVYYQF